MLDDKDRDEEQSRLVDVIMYIIALVQSAFRFSKGLPPFDFESTATAEFLMSRNLPFIEDQNVDYRTAHKAFLVNMFQCGWRLGSEDFVNRTYPDLVDYSELSQEAKEMYAFLAGIVASAREFYQSLYADLESEFMDSFNSEIKGKPITWLGGAGITH